MKRLASQLLALLLLIPAAAQAQNEAQEEPQAEAEEEVLEEDAGPKINWVSGPKAVELGTIAVIKITEEQAFANSADAQKLMEAMGNSASPNVLGLITPKDENESWMLFLEHEPVGYVKDDEKDKIDADALLKSISEGTEEGNSRRKARGIPAIHVTGWQDPPHYDETTHNLTWSVLAKDEAGEEVVNYNVRLLGREGYMSIVLADDPKQLEKSKPVVESLLKTFLYKPGKTYAEWRPGDKVAEYGLTALVAAGAGAAAVKLGLFAVLGKFLAKAWKLVVLGVVGIGASIKKALGRRE